MASWFMVISMVLVTMMAAAKSSKFYTMLNKPGGASRDGWASIKAAYAPLVDRGVQVKLQHEE